MLLPLFLDWRNRPCLVVGAGRIAARKIAALIDAGARVTVVSPEAADQVRAWAAAERLTWLPRAYAPGDGEGALLVVAATTDEAVNDAVCRDALGRGQWVVCAQRAELGNAHFPALVRRGGLQIAVSTGGASPSLAQDIRNRLADQFDDAYAAAIDWLAAQRDAVQRRIASAEGRHAALRALYALDPVRHFAQGEERLLEARAKALIEEAATAAGNEVSAVKRQEDQDA